MENGVSNHMILPDTSSHRTENTESVCFLKNNNEQKANLSFIANYVCNSFLSKYQVIVKEMVKSPSFDAARLTDYKTAKGKGLNYYITAELKLDAFQDNPEFVLGDGKRYGKFNNVKLDENKMYEIAERALTGETQVISLCKD